MPGRPRSHLHLDLQPKGALQRYWNVHYQFCDVSAVITVYAKSEIEARAKRSINFACAV